MTDSDVSGANVRPLLKPAGGNPDDNRSTAAILAEIQQCAHVAVYAAGVQLLRDRYPDIEEEGVDAKVDIEALQSYLCRRADVAGRRALHLAEVLGRRLCDSWHGGEVLTEDEKRDLNERY